MGILKVSVVFKEMIWGGKKLNEKIGFTSPYEKTGEAWVVCAHHQGDSIILSGEFKGMPLSSVYRDHRERFGQGENKVFPLMVKIIDANLDLSVQVHPDDMYAKQFENSLGKEECWFVLEAEKGTKLVIGHKAQNIIEFRNALNLGQMESILLTSNITKGDFFYIRAGTIHAIGSGSLIYEVQQNSQITYRIYDYGRKDALGNERELHIQKALDVIKIPHHVLSLQSQFEIYNNVHISKLVDDIYFSLTRISVKGKGLFNLLGEFNIIGMIEGTGEINGIEFRNGEHAVVTNDVRELEINGECTIMISTPKGCLL